MEGCGSKGRIEGSDKRIGRCEGQKGLDAIQGGSDKRIGLRDGGCVRSWGPGGGLLGVWIRVWFRVWIGYIRGMD